MSKVRASCRWRPSPAAPISLCLTYASAPPLLAPAPHIPRWRVALTRARVRLGRVRRRAWPPGELAGRAVVASIPLWAVRISVLGCFDCLSGMFAVHNKHVLPSDLCRFPASACPVGQSGAAGTCHPRGILGRPTRQTLVQGKPACQKPKLACHTLYSA